MSDDSIRVLVVDDDQSFLDDLSALMGRKYRVEMATSGRDALAAVEKSPFEAVLLDIDLGRGMDGFEVLEKLQALEPDLPVIMVTRDSSSASAVAALKKGAVDYVDKKPDLVDLERRISRALDGRRLSLENRFLRQEVASLKGRMIGDSPAMVALREEIRLASEGASPVLIVGETGTGKELVARAIHERSCGASPFVALNCAAVPRDLFESRLFGSERGAFTGAERRIVGVFELAGDGVLFLDEITEMDASLQAKLLRAIEERVFERLGGSRKIPFLGRVLASSNRDLGAAVESGPLRQDLYYRLSTYVIEVPPLRERRDDIPRLVEHFLRRKATELKKPPPSLEQEMMEDLCAYAWPGNVRELENTIEAFIVRGRLTLPGAALSGRVEQAEEDVFGLSYERAKEAILQRFQRKYITARLAACGGDVAAAADRMGLTRFGLQKLMKRLGL